MIKAPSMWVTYLCIFLWFAGAMLMGFAVAGIAWSLMMYLALSYNQAEIIAEIGYAGWVSWCLREFIIKTAVAHAMKDAPSMMMINGGTGVQEDALIEPSITGNEHGGNYL